ncbi:uncharacterized protein LOC122506140 [Leptopilina heterotoma]|uniref:uncharacterized protein LOC122506140 n=1 Tax=Leptopilina heterotoma TaxID=63436 RepID=UPI001CA9C92E|nr:uncharacterized protein LOC122506140 [Leptopilina heterotoma]
MFNNQSLDERIQGSIFSNDGYDYRNESIGNRYFMKWSPQEEMKFYSKSRYGSPRMLSKSVPRKNRNLTRCRINRSLNFDTGLTKTELKFKNSPNTSLESICCDDDKQLSRSAKIMKALNFTPSPISVGKKKVNKTLNFDFSPSPNKLLNYNRSPCNIVRLNLSTSSPKIVKSLNFDSSPAESNISSILCTSIDSIDENQNQTPSQRRRSVKKSLKYNSTPLRKEKEFVDKSPLLRSELREKIDNIIKISTPDVQKTVKNKKPFIKEVFVSTPRNLFNDFDDDDDNETKGPGTPKNRIQLIPESMSAIKRSHKKERFPRLVEEDDDQLAEKLDISNEQRPLTPPIEEAAKNTGKNFNSIKRSHKKDKSLKSSFNRLDDESHDGSIFNYSGIDSCGDDDDDNNINIEPKITPSKLNYDSDSNTNSSEIPPVKTPEEKGPSTPKNSINIMERITGSSIKKSHKKLKDKRKILKANIIETIESSERSTTPENTNSSRLLLPNFSSVKKSHKKDKRSKILTNFARRQKMFSYDREKLQFSSSTSEDEILKINQNLKSPDTSPQKRKSTTNLDDEFHPLLNDSDEYTTAHDEEFKIFTPIKKIKSAPNRKFTATEFDLPLTRCETPIFTHDINDHHDDQKQIQEHTFITPEKNYQIPPKEKSTPKEKRSKRKTNGKITPKNNRSSLNLIANVNSVKKSHKKEKKGNRFSIRNESMNQETPMKEIFAADLLNVSNFLTPDSSLHYSNNTSEASFKNISQMATKFLQNYEFDDSKPSTSYEIVNDKEEEYSKSLTPPNLLKMKKYFKKQQTESIKKSHKKKREELRNNVIVQDLEFSDDGSIFTNEDRINDFSVIDRAIIEKNQNGNSNDLQCSSIVVNMNESFFNQKVRTTRSTSRCLLRNLSKDGSLFDTDEEGH